MSADERALFSEANPLGFILFKRNIEDHVQLRRLCDDLHETIGHACPILIDQEGGRVQRMGPPHWPAYPAAAEFQGDIGLLAQKMGELAQDLIHARINVNCAPVLDLAQPETDASIGNRSYGADVETVVKSGRAVIESFLAEGVTPVVKHMPGLGRGTVDSHHALPVISAPRAVLSAHDFAPFKALSAEYGTQIWGMVAHALFTDIDPVLPSTLSPTIISEIIREEIGFEGLLLSDDISMGALKNFGDLKTVSLMCLEAGCDVICYCAADLAEMDILATHLPRLPEEKQGFLAYA
ncbi:MAG: glycoside hydrolase family 3 N-terminal domain-containing protein [Pseudobdellovibrionaceae bacterium]